MKFTTKLKCIRTFMKPRLYVRHASSNTFPDIDLNYYCDLRNTAEIEENIKCRKGVGNISEVLKAYNNYIVMKPSTEDYQKVKQDLFDKLSKLPNKTHPITRQYREEPQIVKLIGDKQENKNSLEFSEIVRRLNLMRTDKLGQTCGHKSYYFMGELAELEEALIKYTVTALLKENFQLISVPDILPSHILESCGMAINSDRTQIYSLDPVHHGPDLYLSGTAEMSLAGLLMDSVHSHKDLPMKLAAVSRCFRAETSSVLEERGIYRVHQFTKVEMFIVAKPEQSEELLEYLRDTQEQLFTQLGIHMKVLDMPPHELGAPAYRKYDIEAWMPGRNNYGEITSCSNCTDYQSRRLHIKYTDENDNQQYVHTLNGTACAVPRVLIALIETHQDPKGKIHIPEVLQPFMNGKKYISKNNLVPELKLNKIKK